MNCTKCKSERLATVSGKCEDKMTVKAGGHRNDGYVPSDLGIGGGDYVNFSYCLACGTIQGPFPLPETLLERGERE